MRNNNFITNKTDIHQIINLKLIQPTMTKSLLLHKPKLNHPLFKNPNSCYSKHTYHHELSPCYDSKHYYQFRSITSSNDSPTKLSLKPNAAKLYSNNYKQFPKRGLLSKPHVVKNTNIHLNLFSRRSDNSQSKNTFLARTLSAQMKWNRQKMKTLGSPLEKRDKKRGHQRVESAILERRPSVKLSPWDMPQEFKDYDKF